MEFNLSNYTRMAKAFVKDPTARAIMVMHIAEKILLRAGVMIRSEKNPAGSPRVEAMQGGSDA